MKKYLLLILITAIFAQNDSTTVINEKDEPYSIKTFKFGIDINSDYKQRLDDEQFSFSLEDPFTIAGEIHINEKFDAGLEIMMKSDTQLGSSSVSHMSFYGLYNFYSDEDISIMPKFGLSTMKYTQDSNGYYYNDVDYDSKGGILYGFQIEYKDMIHISYTKHFGQVDIDNAYGNDSTMKTTTSRFNISYLFNI